MVEFLGDDVWEHIFAIPINMSSLTTKKFAESDLVNKGSCFLSTVRTTHSNVCQIYLGTDHGFIILLPARIE